MTIGDSGFGDKVSAWRKKSGLSQIDIAELLDVEKSYIQSLEKGRVLPTRLARLGFQKFFETYKKENFNRSPKTEKKRR